MAKLKNDQRVDLWINFVFTFEGAKKLNFNQTYIAVSMINAKNLRPTITHVAGKRMKILEIEPVWRTPENLQIEIVKPESLRLTYAFANNTLSITFDPNTVLYEAVEMKVRVYEPLFGLESNTFVYTVLKTARSKNFYLAIIFISLMSVVSVFVLVLFLVIPNN